MIGKLLVVVLVLAAIAGGGYWFWTSTPQYAVQQASQAIRAHNIDAFHNWVDVQSVSSAAVEDVLAEPVRNVGGGGLLERVIGLGFLTVLRPTVVEKMRNRIDDAVAKTGLEADTSAASQPQQPRGLLGQLAQMIKPPSLTDTLREYGFTKANYRGLGETRSQDGSADVGLRFFIPRRQGEMQVHLSLMNVNGHWRIVRIANLQEIVRDVVGS
jgi:hypothetical protein